MVAEHILCECVQTTHIKYIIIKIFTLICVQMTHIKYIIFKIFT